ncbi:hypothetical protein DB346_17430 [Verrucomicrobia bacterium LW23]|nr:hypothetical protein DB346_17430 [Verrucomicrobia bacterium LW23]
MPTLDSIIIFDWDGDLRYYEDLRALAANIESNDLYDDGAGVRNRIAYDSSGCKYMVSLSEKPDLEYVQMYDFKYPAKIFKLPPESRDAEGLNRILTEFEGAEFRNASTEDILRYNISQGNVTTLSAEARNWKPSAISEWLHRWFG